MPDAPVAFNQSVTAANGTATPITLGATDADGDPLTFSIVMGVTHGSLSAVNGNQVTYTPAAGYSGSDSFWFRAFDGGRESNVATVSITVGEAGSLFVTTALDINNRNRRTDQSARSDRLRLHSQRSAHDYVCE